MRHKGRIISTRTRRRLSNLKLFTKKEVKSAEKNQTSEESQDSQGSFWNGERRIIELDTLIEGLRSCLHCSNSLRLECRNIYFLFSKSLRYLNLVGIEFQFYTITAMINVGIGEQQINNILAELNIPTIHHKTLKEREREVGRAFEEIADKSCNMALEEEKLHICTNSGDGTQAPQVSCDGAWQKRGTGQNYDSLSGHVTVVGKHTKKCLAFGLACRSCRKCTHARRKKKQAKTHNCKRNWSGSAKGMEPFLTVKCLKSLKDKGFDVKKLTMDDDTTTFIRAKKAISPELTKSSDKNHVVKNLTSNLYKLRQGNKNLSVKIINYFKKCFSYAVQQNRGSPASLRENLEAIVPHAFGEHVKCNEKWCGFLKDPTSYKHKSLPHGRDLEDEGLRESLSSIFAKYTTNADKFSDLESSNANENLNHMIAKKAPKSQHYSGSESLAYRLSASIAQKNEGHRYLLEVNKTCNLSPGKHATERFHKLDQKRNVKKVKQGTIQAKRERLKAKENRHTVQVMEELREGTTYESGVTLNKEEGQLDEEIQEIPLPATTKKRTTNTLVSTSTSVVIIDLETTGFATDSSIIQIAARELKTSDHFVRFVMPQNGFIPSTVSKLTGIEVHGLTMYYNLIPVESTTCERAIGEFLVWLKKHKSPVLVAHNAKFDARILVSTICRLKMEDNLKDISGFSDTLKLFKNEFPGRSSYKLESLTTDLIDDQNENLQLHNAEADVNVLTNLLKRVSDVHEKLMANLFSTDSVLVNNQKLINKKMYFESFSRLIDQNVLSKTQSSNLAAQGISEMHMSLASKRAGKDGIRNILRGKITKLESVVEKLSVFYGSNTCHT
ncbi:uncharacterized protein LOC134270633 [Saccostrea cucullata]|uniref:uncharacterized protein LOC134270633 n=1 Tax=Saccostrea cuccullata TaxID=36930 RepID=UPI002ED1AE1C